MTEPASAWQLPTTPPTTTCWLWPGDAPPTTTEVAAGLSAVSPKPIDFTTDIPHRPPSAIWAMGTRDWGMEQPMFLWAEPALPPDPNGPYADLIRAARWMVCVQTELDVTAPIENHSAMMRLLAGGLSASPLAIDTECMRWWQREELNDAYLGEHITAPAHELWVVHAIHDPKRPDLPMWVHTHGLHRCGRPELDMLEVPPAHGRHAMRLVNECALRFLDDPPPEPGRVIDVGSNMQVVLQRVEDVAKYLADDVPGSMHDRALADDVSHGGVRAAICDPLPKGLFRRAWQPPLAALEALAADTGVIYRTDRATQRDAELARATWPELAMAFATMRDRVGDDEMPKTMIVLVKAAFDPDPDPNVAAYAGQAREHLWFHIEQIEGDTAIGDLINTPLRIPGMKEGDRVRINRSQASDWQVAMKSGMMRPHTARKLWKLVHDTAASPPTQATPGGTHAHG